MELKPRKGAIAICGIGCLGLITEDQPKEVKYQDGNNGLAYTGIHLTDKVTSIGSPWSSRNPKVIFYIECLEDIKEDTIYTIKSKHYANPDCFGESYVVTSDNSGFDTHLDNGMKVKLITVNNEGEK